MGLETLAHSGLPFLLVLVGFWGIFQAAQARRKVLAWCLYQAGWILALFLLEPKGAGLTLALGTLVLLVNLGIALLLFASAPQTPVEPPLAPKGSGRRSAK